MKQPLCMPQSFACSVMLAVVVLLPNAIAHADVTKPCVSDPMPINYTDIITCDLNPASDIDLYLLEGRVNDQVDIVASAEHVCVGAALIDPDGNVLASDICGRIVKKLATTGTHVIRIASGNPGSTPAYELSLQCISGPCLAPSGISGRVAVDGMPIVGRKVKLFQNGVKVGKTLTDEHGNYEFDPINPGRYEIRINGLVVP
jgi:hypothetical protein